MQIAILSIGDELLAGKTVNTNATWLGEQITRAGHTLGRVVVIGDDPATIRDAILELCARADFVITTGGLGPTEDDRTVAVLCDLLGSSTVVDTEQLRLITERFARSGREPNRRSLDQANVPVAATVIPNSYGTAPGLLCRIDDTPVVSLPGVPYEMKGLFAKVLDEHIGVMAGRDEREWLVAGIPESELAERLQEIEGLVGPDLGLAYLPSLGTIRLRLFRIGEESGLIERYHRAADIIAARAAEWIVSDRGEALAETVERVMRARKVRLTTAESCTGGMIGATLTAVPGCGEFYEGGVISYSNDVKEVLLLVDPQIVVAFGAVSEQTARAMAEGALKRIDEADFSIAVTGIAGPTGGTPDKPVGTVWIGLSSRDGTEAKLFHFAGEREVIRSQATNAALVMLIKKVRREVPRPQ